MKPFLTPRELGDLLSVSDSTIRAMANRDEIPGALKIGKQWRFPHSCLKHIAPCPDTMDTEWQDADPESPRTTEPAKGTGPSAGANTDGNAKSVGSKRRTKPRTKPTASASAFDTDFPEFARRAM